MSLKFRANNFSIETAYSSNTTAQHNTYKTTKPKIDLLMKRIIDDRKREKKKIVAFGSVFLSIILIFNFF